MKRKAVFLDRDGTIIEEANYLSDPDGVKLIENAAKGIKQLRDAGYLVIVTSNQSGIARGYFDEPTLALVNQRMQEHLKEENTDIDGLYYCPHHKKGKVESFAMECDCRKPNPGMIHQATKDFEIDLEHSWVVGDKLADVQFGQAVGCQTALVLTGYGEKTREAGFEHDERPTLIVKNLHAAALAIIASCDHV